jgi:hypothetical protein
MRSCSYCDTGFSVAVRTRFAFPMRGRAHGFRTPVLSASHHAQRSRLDTFSRLRACESLLPDPYQRLTGAPKPQQAHRLASLSEPRSSRRRRGIYRVAAPSASLLTAANRPARDAARGYVAPSGQLPAVVGWIQEEVWAQLLFALSDEKQSPCSHDVGNRVCGAAIAAGELGLAHEARHVIGIPLCHGHDDAATVVGRHI